MASVKNRSMKPEVVRIYEDLEAWLDHCRFNLLRFDPADLYKSREWRDFFAKSNNDRRGYRRERVSRTKG